MEPPEPESKQDALPPFPLHLKETSASVRAQRRILKLLTVGSPSLRIERKIKIYTPICLNFFQLTYL